MSTVRITPPPTLRLRLSARGRGLQPLGQSRPVAVVRVTQGLTGAPGSSGQAQISADPGNTLTQGSDQRLFVPAPQLASAQW